MIKGIWLEQQERILNIIQFLQVNAPWWNGEGADFVI